ncbi:hypothetical protein KFU94_61665 [Chloroflexi bacterium TSY]|nr:hypothetical protein [Chloroflexi bacterium TSY]
MFYRAINKGLLLLLLLIFSAASALVLLAQSPTADPEVIDPPSRRQINVEGAIVRESPDVASREIARLAQGTIVTVVARQGEWRQIEAPEIFPKGGWILSFFLSVRPPALSSDSSVELVEPLDSILSGRRTFAWRTDIQLAPNQAFEMIFWEVGTDPLIDGFSPVDAGKEKAVSVDLQKAARSLTQLKSGQEYHWGVLLVTTRPYQRLQFLGATHRFRFEDFLSDLQQITIALQPTATPTTPTATPTTSTPTTSTPTLTATPPTATPTPTTPTLTPTLPTATPTPTTPTLTPTPPTATPTRFTPLDCIPGSIIVRIRVEGPGTIDRLSENGRYFPTGSSLSLEAFPDENSAFVGWTVTGILEFSEKSSRIVINLPKEFDSQCTVFVIVTFVTLVPDFGCSNPIQASP